MLKHIGKCHHFTAFTGVGIANHAAAEVVGRYHIAQGSAFGNVLYAHLLDVETVIYTERSSIFPAEVEGVKARLRVAQGDVHGAGLQHFVWVTWRETQRASAIDDIFSKPHGNLCDTVLGSLVVDRVVVERAPYARE